MAILDGGVVMAVTLFTITTILAAGLQHSVLSILERKYIVDVPGVVTVYVAAELIFLIFVFVVVVC